MSYTWVGYAAGVVALGLIVLLGNVVFYGGDLYMHAGNWEVAKLAIPAMITVTGWFVTIRWAFHHAKVASDENRRLQYKILNTNHRKSIMDDLVVAYAELVGALESFRYRAGLLRVNVELKHDNKIKRPDLGKLYRDTKDCVGEVVSQKHQLRFSVNRLVIFDDLNGDAYQEHTDLLSSIDGLLKGKTSLAYQYQEKFNQYKRDGTDENAKDLMRVIAEMKEKQQELIEKCMDNVAKLMSHGKRHVLNEINETN